MASPSFWTSFRSFWFKDELHFRPLRDVGRLGTISFTLLLMLDLCNSNHKLAVTLLMYGTGPRRPKTWHRGASCVRYAARPRLANRSFHAATGSGVCRARTRRQARREEVRPIHLGAVRACEQRAVDGNHRAVLRIVRRLLCPERL